MNNNKPYIAKIHSWMVTKGWMYAFLIILLFFYCIISKSNNVILLIIYPLIPFSLIILSYLFNNYDKAIYYVFTAQFGFTIINNIKNIPLGIVNLCFSILVIFSIIVYITYKKVDFKNALNFMFYAFTIWSVYCLFEIANPNHVQEAWNIYIMQYAFYPIFCAIIIPVTIKKIQNIKILLYIWSIFVIIATIKGIWQKNYGFNEQELYFLYVLGGAKTHIIWSGTRYFSYFTDATNYGVHMGMAITCFSIIILYLKSKYEKLYFFSVVCFAIYSMLISGTRAAIAVPIIGILIYIILSANIKKILIGASFLVGIVLFFMFTSIGSSNPYIYRMRTAFRPTQDASYQVRNDNRKKMKELMITKPFGFGLGLGGKSERFNAKENNPYPPDSWLITVWTDTGIVGLILYLVVHILLFAKCFHVINFKINNKLLKGILTSWITVNVGFFVVLYTSDVMQYPNSIIVYTGFALCFAGVHIDKSLAKTETEKENQEEKSDAV